MSDKRLLIVIRHPPHGSSWVREGVEAALVGAALGRPPGIIFEGDGVLALLDGQHNGALDQKGSARMIEGLEMYDIEPLWFDRDSLDARGLSPGRLMPGCQETSLGALIREYDVVLSF